MRKKVTFLFTQADSWGIIGSFVDVGFVQRKNFLDNILFSLVFNEQYHCPAAVQPTELFRILCTSEHVACKV